MNKDFLERARDVGETGRKKKTSTEAFEQVRQPDPPDKVGELQYKRLAELKAAIDEKLKGAPVQIFKQGAVVPHPYHKLKSGWEDRWQLMYGFHPKVSYGISHRISRVFDHDEEHYNFYRLTYNKYRTTRTGGFADPPPSLISSLFDELNYIGEPKYWLWDGIGLCKIITRHGFTYFDDAVEDILDIAAASYNLQQKNLWEHRPGIF
ncbi:MAG: hypothetical protein H6861_01615 [Rhodospirillales bacterium]|nr:hypothetical protein [Rhodospirillales bacterium]